MGMPFPDTTNIQTMKTRLLPIAFLLLLQFLHAGAQTATTYTWWDPTDSKVQVIEGQAWPKEVKDPYDRLPARAEKTVRDRVWSLSHDAAGLCVSFVASTSEIVVKYKVKNEQAFPHMPATGVSGVDLYAIDSDGHWMWAAGKYKFGDTITYSFKGLLPNDKYHAHGRRYRLYLPLYNTVEWLKIGVPSGSAFTPLAVPKEKPIVVYGTSIAQGAAASRPGMAWPAILGRKMERPLVNLGFSGNAWLDKEVVDLLPEIDAKIFVLDCLPNLVDPRFSASQIKDKILYAVNTLHKQRNSTPILLIQHDGYADDEIDTMRKKAYTNANSIQEAAFNQLRSEGINNVYLLSKADIGQITDFSVDGTHPTDLGMMQYANACEKTLRQILNEPTGAFSTTIPCTQLRDANTYNWQDRHNEILSQNMAKAPGIVFMGNSITHYWGGTSSISNGPESWKTYMEPLGVRNFGYGWDRVENVLWRVYHDEIDGYSARQVVLLIGTNNLSINSDEEIVEGLKLLVNEIKIRQPKSDVLVLALLPRRKMEDRVSQINKAIKDMAKSQHVSYADVGKLLMNGDKINEQLFKDGLHPNEDGYQKVVQLLLPHLKK